MACFHPRNVTRFTCGYDARVNHDSGKPRLFFSQQKAWENKCTVHSDGACMENFNLPCGQCDGCRIKKANDWKNRIMHEARYYPRKSFITLTYDNQHLPENRTLVKEHLQLFFKRLRMKLYRGVLNERGYEEYLEDTNAIGPRLESGAYRSTYLGVEYVTDIKYFACGEYGEAKGRPHYHAVLLGWDWPDKHSVPNNPGTKDPLYGSTTLEKIWGKGNVTIGNVTPKSAAYVAAYTMKKVYKNANEEYRATKRLPPFILMSKGIGARFFDEYRTDIYPADCIVPEDGSPPQSVPRYYDKKLEALDPELLQHIKDQRKKAALAPNMVQNNTRERLATREQSLKLRLACHKLRRNLYQNEALKPEKGTK